MTSRSKCRVRCCVSRPASAHRGLPGKRCRVEYWDPLDQSTTADWVRRCKGTPLYELCHDVCLQLVLRDKEENLQHDFLAQESQDKGTLS